MKPKLYIENSIVSYLTARPSRDIIMAARQELTRLWWDQKRESYDLYVSGFVTSEAAAGDAEAARLRLSALDGIPEIALTETATELAEALVKAGPLPEKGSAGCLAHRCCRQRRRGVSLDLELQAPRQRDDAEPDRAVVPFEGVRAADHLYAGRTASVGTQGSWRVTGAAIFRFPCACRHAQDLPRPISPPKNELQLDDLTRRRSQKAEPVKRALVLLAADESEYGPAWTDEQIAGLYPVSLRTVERLRQRLVEHGLEIALYGLPRGPKQPARSFDGVTEAHLVALRCSKPPEGQARWTLQLLADEMVALDYAESMSGESVRRLLKKTSSSPGASRQWVIPQAGPEFVCQMEAVLEVYARPYDEANPVVCLDEKRKQLTSATRSGLHRLTRHALHRLRVRAQAE